MNKNIYTTLHLFLLAVIFFSLNGKVLTAKELTLEECLKIGEQNNLGIRSSRLGIESSENSVNSALDGFYGISISGKINPSLSDDYDTGTDLFKKNIINRTLSAFGNLSLGLIDNYKYSKTSLESSRLNHQNAINTLKYNIIQSFFTCIIYEEDLKVKKEKIEYSKLQYEQTKLKYDIGSLTRSDLLTAEVELSRDSLSIIGAISNLNIKKQNLINVINVNINFNDLELKYNDLDEDLDKDFALTELINEALENRLDIKISKKNLELAELSLEKNYHDTFFPSLSTMVSTSWTKTDYFPENSPFYINNDSKDISASLSLDWNLSLSDYNSLDRGKVVVKQNKVYLDQKQQAVINEVKLSYLDLINQKENLDRLDKHIELAKQNLELANEMFKIGNRSIIEQIKAKNDYIGAVLNKITSKYQYKIAVSNMYKTIGK